VGVREPLGQGVEVCVARRRGVGVVPLTPNPNPPEVMLMESVGD